MAGYTHLRIERKQAPVSYVHAGADSPVSPNADFVACTSTACGALCSSCPFLRAADSLRAGEARGGAVTLDSRFIRQGCAFRGSPRIAGRSWPGSSRRKRNESWTNECCESSEDESSDASRYTRIECEQIGIARSGARRIFPELGVRERTAASRYVTRGDIPIG
jgi:hypothetical protein